MRLPLFGSYPSRRGRYSRRDGSERNCLTPVPGTAKMGQPNLAPATAPVRPNGGCARASLRDGRQERSPAVGHESVSQEAGVDCRSYTRGGVRLPGRHVRRPAPNADGGIHLGGYLCRRNRAGSGIQADPFGSQPRRRRIGRIRRLARPATTRLTPPARPDTSTRHPSQRQDDPYHASALWVKVPPPVYRGHRTV
jgi:hypothetical protein